MWNAGDLQMSSENLDKLHLSSWAAWIFVTLLGILKKLGGAMILPYFTYKKVGEKWKDKNNNNILE